MSAACRIDGSIWFLHLPELVEGGLTTTSRIGAGWLAFPFALDQVEGVGLATGAASPAGELVLNLGLTGRHRLHLAHNPALRVWLDGDTGYCELPGDASAIRDVALPAMDFTNRRLHVAPVRSCDRNLPLTLFYLRAEPAPPEATAPRNLIVTNDGHGVFCTGLDHPRDIYRHLYPYQDSHVFRMLWGVYGGGPLTLRQDSRFSDLRERSAADAYYPHGVTFYRSLKRFMEAGVDPLAVVRQATREYHLELHFYCRMSAFYGPFPHTEWTSRFFTQHPQWRCVDEHGQTLNLMSYAWPGVQDYILAYFDELLDYQPEGLCLAFNRGLPLMVCEQPVCEAFARRYGRAPKLPDECDRPEMLAVRHELLADFVARVRELTDRRGRALSCIVPRDFAHNRLMGLDIDLLAQRQLFESILIGAGHGDDPALNMDLTPVQALKAHGSKVYAGGSAVRAHGEAWTANNLPARARHMANILDAGLDGGWFWDAESLIGLEWEAHRRFGERDTLEQIAQQRWPTITRHNTRRIHDLVVGRYNPWHAY